uniref:Uncharacterized protein n=1 Tax=Leersia perrieri TaxID=77586 RepID=A0A0D9WQH1_9ORYZ
MRRKKHLDRGGGGGGGGGGTELFICFTSRPSTASASSAAPATLRPSTSSKLLSPGRATAAADTAPGPPPLRPSLSRRLRNSGSLKGGQSPMFPSSSSGGGGRRGRGGFEPAEPSSPKVTCIGQVRVKGGKRKPKHGSSAAALRSRSRRGGVGAGGSAEASFRRAGDDRDGPAGKNQGWVYQIPVNICEALKTFGSCGGRSLCSPSRGGGGGTCDGDRGSFSAGAGVDKKRRRPPASGSWLCGAAVARCLLAIQEEEDDEVGKGAAVVPAEDVVKASEVGLVMQGWGDVEEEEHSTVVVGEVEVEKKEEILLVGGKEDEGRVSVCIPPRNALLLMRCRSDPVRMAALATRFWGSPAAANVSQVVNAADDDNDDDDEEQEEDNGGAETDEECEEQARDSAVSAKEAECCEPDCDEDGDCEGGEVDPVVVETSECGGDLGEEANDDGDCGGDGEKVETEEVPIVRKDSVLEVVLSGEAAGREIQLPEMVEAAAEAKEEVSVPRAEKEEEETKGRRSSSCCSPSTALKEDRKLRRLSSRRRVGSNIRASSGSDRAGRRHSFSAETEARRSSFSSLKDSRRASFSIDRDGRRWSFSIEQEHLVAEPKVLMGCRKSQKISSEQESEKDCVVHAAPNSAEESQESHDDGKEEATLDGEEGGTQETEVDEKGENVEVAGVEAQDVVEEQKQRRKKSGELPDCLLLMMYEPKLSMEVSKETWVCSTDFVHWKSYKGQNRRNCRQQKAGCNDAASEELKDTDNAEGTSDAKNAEEDEAPASVNSASMPPLVVQKPPPKEAAEKKLKIELPLVTGAATYAPFVLKRCKSEPMRSSARLAPDACFWKDRHRPLNATGVGF